MVERKPTGWGRYNALMHKLVGVPKEDVNNRIADEQAKRKAKREKK